MNRYLQLLRNRPHYRNLWLASLISFAGDWFNVIGTVILINRYTDSGVAIGALFLARTLPPFILSPIVGVVADRFNRKALLIVTDVLRAVIVLGFLFVNSPERAWLVYVLTVAQFVLSSFFHPAKSAILPSLLENDEELLLANTLSGATWSAMLTLGAAMGGVMAAIFGVQAALVIDAATFLLSALVVTRIVVPDRPVVTTSSKEGGGWREYKEGMAYLFERPRVGLISLVKGFTQIGAPDIMIAIYAAQIFPVGEDGAITLGLLFAASGVGAVLGPFIGNTLTDGSADKLQLSIGVGFVIVALGWAAFGWAPSLPLAMLGLTIRYIGGSVNWTYSTVLLQMKTKDQYLGRVFAFDLAFYTLFASLSVWLTGVVLDNTGLGPRLLAVWIGILSALPLIPWILTFRDSYRQTAHQQS